MARKSSLDKMSYSQLAALRTGNRRAYGRETRLRSAPHCARSSQTWPRSRPTLDEVFGKGRRKGKGSVAIKYRDPKNPENTWTGRGRMPRWMVAATKGSKAKKEDFLI